MAIKIMVREPHYGNIFKNITDKRIVKDSSRMDQLIGETKDKTRHWHNERYMGVCSKSSHLDPWKRQPSLKADHQDNKRGF